MGTKQRHIATEQRSFEEILNSLPEQTGWAEVVFSRLKRIGPIPDDALVLDIGSAGGEFLVACSRLGYRVEGIEPCEEARRNTLSLSKFLGIPLSCVDGRAESIPFENDMFDVVHASYVMEHVSDVKKAFSEIYRILKPGGVFWFSAASAMCPVQDEIRGFPCFSWYPQGTKQRIMNWAKEVKPSLVGYTTTPAINWFTPWMARELLSRSGFQHIYDRWDIRGLDEGGALYKIGLRMIRATAISKTIADVLVPSCSYAAVK
jgi:SAM-dependent methyltransferase